LLTKKDIESRFQVLLWSIKMNDMLLLVYIWALNEKSRLLVFEYEFIWFIPKDISIDTIRYRWGWFDKTIWW